MKSPFKLAAISSAVLSTFCFSALAQEAVTAEPDTQGIEHMVVFGNKTEVNNIPGSATLIDEAELKKFEYTDIMRVLASAPGVYVLEEDGYGLRPNIGMRGTGMNRSDKITVMEDGVLAAPAPYASPSAYYFPTISRMTGVEVLKGSSSVKFGPRTTGGILNMVSVQIPEAELAGKFNVAVGEDGYSRVYGALGGSGKHTSSVIEVNRYQADGFKSINGASDDTGFVKNDIVGKFNFHTSESAKHYQELELKVKYSDEDSDETYMGLTDDDFANDPFNRYSSSQKDNMDTEHKQIQLDHFIELNDKLSLSSTAYYNDFHRNWYKTNKVGEMVTDADTGETSIKYSSLGSGGIDIAAAFDANPEGEIYAEVKANNRDYESKGVQSELNWVLGDHDIIIGARYHEDEMDRYQWVDDYVIDSSQSMTLSEAGTPGTDSNRIDSAEAFAMFVHDEFAIGDFVISGGLRYEDITLERHDWGKSDPARDNEAAHKENDVSVWLPAIGATYQINENWVVLAGVQKGFAPPAPGNEEGKEEKSWNYETGFRFVDGAFTSEVIGFYADYSNMHGNCTASQGCDDDKIDDQNNAGEADIEGLEVAMSYSLDAAGFQWPMQLSYTYTSTEFKNDFSADFETWGDVKSGDEMPYVPENQLYFSVGLHADSWTIDVATRYTSETRSTAGQGSIDSMDAIESKTLVDIAANYFIDENQKVYLTIDNALDKEYATTRTHGSLLVGKPRTAMVGYQYSF